METELRTITQPAVDQSEVSTPLLKDDPITEETQNGVEFSNESIEEMEKKYAAFVRHDVYGRLGRGDLPWVEKFLLGLGLVFLLPIRVVSGLTLLVIYYVICRVCTAFLPTDVEEDFAHMGTWRRKVIVRSGRFLSRLVLIVFGFYWISKNIRVKEHDPQLNDETTSRDESEDLTITGAIVSNHISYIDILYHMSSSFPSFVAKGSVADLPLVGLISKCLGCVYVQREAKSPDFRGVSGVVNQRIQEALENKFAPRILLFPEGTTTNGDYLLPFKTGAFLAGAPVLPVLLRYPFQRLSVAWDSITGARHLVLLLCQFVNYMEVTHLPAYHPSDEEREDPKLYAENVRKLMAHEGNLIMSDVGLTEKWTYMDALNGNATMPPVLHQKED